MTEASRAVRGIEAASVDPRTLWRLSEVKELKRPEESWRVTYARTLLVGDLLVLIVAVFVAQVARFGLTELPAAVAAGVSLSYPMVGVAMAVVWWLSLQAHRTRSSTLIGHGSEEYRRVVVATFRAFAFLAIISLALKMDASRLYLATTLPLGLFGLLIERKIARVSLHRMRERGEALTDVLVIGGPRSAAQLAEWFDKHPAAGFRVGGVWVPDATDGELLAAHPLMAHPALRSVPVMSSRVQFRTAINNAGAGTVVVTDTEHLGHEMLGELVWTLEGTGIDLLLSPNVLGVVSSRLSLHDISSMPMLEVAEPQYAGASRLGKTLFDRIGAAMLILLFSPILIVTALAVKLTSPGPVFYKQTRVGLHGRDFGMIKFRSMRVGADAELEALLAAEGKTLAELPKLTRDPRVTAVGAFIRRFSIDELPQLFNVVKGDMSLVGPRPQRHFEVEQYDHVATRRLTVRPGMTGLWQVSGRSDLPYEEAIRLDVHYVANWSMMSDIIILWRTARAVLGSDGAY